MESDIDETAIVEDTRGIDHFLAASVGCLAYRHLIFVDVADDIVGYRRFGYLTMIHFGVPVIHLAHLAFGVGAARIVGQPDEHAVIVGIISADDTTIDTGFLANNKVGAGQ